MDSIHRGTRALCPGTAPLRARPSGASLNLRGGAPQEESCPTITRTPHGQYPPRDKGLVLLLCAPHSKAKRRFAQPPRGSATRRKLSNPTTAPAAPDFPPILCLYSLTSTSSIGLYVIRVSAGSSLSEDTLGQRGEARRGLILIHTPVKPQKNSLGFS